MSRLIVPANRRQFIAGAASIAGALKAWNREHQLSVFFNMQRVDLIVE